MLQPRRLVLEADMVEELCERVVCVLQIEKIDERPGSSCELPASQVDGAGKHDRLCDGEFRRVRGTIDAVPIRDLARCYDVNRWVSCVTAKRQRGRAQYLGDGPRK